LPWRREFDWQTPVLPANSAPATLKLAATVAFESCNLDAIAGRFSRSELVFMAPRRTAIEGSAYLCFAARPYRSGAPERAQSKREIVRGGVRPVVAQ
jgi:hypothetical protein